MCVYKGSTEKSTHSYVVVAVAVAVATRAQHKTRFSCKLIFFHFSFFFLPNLFVCFCFLRSFVRSVLHLIRDVVHSSAHPPTTIAAHASPLRSRLLYVCIVFRCGFSSSSSSSPYSFDYYYYALRLRHSCCVPTWCRVDGRVEVCVWMV